MKFCRKKIISNFMFLFLVLFFFIIFKPHLAYADTFGNYEYSIQNKAVTILNYDGSEAKITIPSSIKGYPVTIIDYKAFAQSIYLENITIPKTVKTIDSEAFYCCPNLNTITVDAQSTYFLSSEGILYNKSKTSLLYFPMGKQVTSFIVPNSVKVIGQSAFEYNAKLTSITLPATMKEIGESAFSYCTSLSNISMPNKLEILNGDAFDDCNSLKSLTIPNGIETIQLSYRCPNLTKLNLPASLKDIDFYYDYDSNILNNLKEINVDPANPNYSSVNGVLYNKAKTSMLYYSKGRPDNSFVIPSTVTILEESAFANAKNLVSITMPNSVKEIKPDVFRECKNLKNISLSNSLTSIGGYSFYNCSSITELNIPKGVEEIGYSTFSGCIKLNKITLPNGIKEIAGNAFYECASLLNISIPNSVEEIGDGAFESCSQLKSISIPINVDQIGLDVCKNCKSLQQINVDKNNMNYSSLDGVLYNKDQSTLICYPMGKDNSSFSIIYGVTLIEDYAFQNAKKLTSIIIPNSITTIGYSSFNGCSGLNNIILPNSVKKIWGCAFSGCTSLKTITLSNSIDTIEYSLFSGCTSLQKITIPNSVKNIGRFSFEQCTGLTNIIISTGATVIEQSAFAGCVSLQNLTIPNSVTTIEESAFIGCASLQSLTIPNNVTSVGQSAFSGCKSLKNIAISNKIKEINYYVFTGCSSLEKVTIPNSVISIWDGAFEGCTKLQSVLLPDSLTRIGYMAFGTSGLKTITIPKNVKSVDTYAFNGCKSLQAVNINSMNTEFSSVNGVVYNKNKTFLNYYPDGKTDSSFTVPDSVNTIGRDAFLSCPKLLKIIISKNVSKLSNDTFSECKNLQEIKVDATNKYYSSDKGILYNKNKTTLLYYPLGKADVSLIIPKSVTTIEYRAFNMGTKLESITLPDNLENMNDYFKNCINLKAINAASTNKRYSSVDGVLFNKNKTILIRYPINKSNTSYTVPSGVKCLDYSSFSECKNIVNVTLPNTVTSIYDFTFYNCAKLTKVTIGSGCTWMGVNVFYQCGKLDTVIFGGNAPAVFCSGDSDDEGMFGDNSPNLKIYYIYGKAGFTNPWDGVKTVPIYVTPTNVKVTSSSYNSINTSWNPVAGANGYEIWRSKEKSAGFSLIATMTGSKTNYNNTGLSTGSTYYYMMRSYKTVGNTKIYSPFSPVLSAKVVPGVPTKLTVVRASSTSIKISWGSVAGANGYEVYRATSKKGNYTIIKTTSLVSYLNTALMKNKYYYYKIRAYRFVGKIKVYGNYSVIGAL